MPSVKNSGSQIAVLGTEHELVIVADPGTYTINVDIAALADSTEKLTLRIYGKAGPADPERGLFGATVDGANVDKLLASVPAVSPHHFRATLEQNGGTGRAFPWAVYQL